VCLETILLKHIDDPGRKKVYTKIHFGREDPLKGAAATD
jgi:hypothetical protein